MSRVCIFLGDCQAGGGGFSFGLLLTPKTGYQQETDTTIRGPARRFNWCCLFGVESLSGQPRDLALCEAMRGK